MVGGMLGLFRYCPQVNYIHLSTDTDGGSMAVVPCQEHLISENNFCAKTLEYYFQNDSLYILIAFFHAGSCSFEERTFDCSTSHPGD